MLPSVCKALFDVPVSSPLQRNPPHVYCRHCEETYSHDTEFGEDWFCKRSAHYRENERKYSDDGPVRDTNLLPASLARCRSCWSEAELAHPGNARFFTVWTLIHLLHLPHRTGCRSPATRSVVCVQRLVRKFINEKLIHPQHDSLVGIYASRIKQILPHQRN